jgi:beta-N-acetylhexosaminidase
MNTLNEQLGPLLIGLAGTELGPGDVGSLQHPAVGGVVLFTRNFASPAQLRELTAAIRERSGRALLITVDHEGGRVQRFRAGFTRLPALAVLGRMYADAPEQALDMAYRHGRVMAGELLVHGVDLSFAPVLDLGRGSQVIGDRAFAADPAAVAALAAYYVAGMHDAGMKACGKHFPGHGSVEADSHTHDVTDPRSLAELRQGDLEPFRALGPGLDAVMMAHVSYPAVDAMPAGYAPRCVRGVLRGDLGFVGAVLSDDLVMHAALIAGKLADRMRAALDAGCDAALVCDPGAAASLLGELTDSPADASEALGRLRGRSPHSAAEMETVKEWRHWRQTLEELERSQWA